jgi:hypothetical protein
MIWKVSGLRRAVAATAAQAGVSVQKTENREQKTEKTEVYDYPTSSGCTD